MANIKKKEDNTEKKELQSIELDISKYKISNSQYKKKAVPVSRKKRATIYTR